MSDKQNPGQKSHNIRGLRIAIIGKLASMSRREAGRLIRQFGGRLVYPVSPEIDLLVIGEETKPEELEATDPAVQQAIESGRIERLQETELWQRLGLLDSEAEAKRLYTPAMVAELVGVPVSTIRRWQRKGLLRPVRFVRRLAYFSFEQVNEAKRLAQLLQDSGVSTQRLEHKLSRLAQLAQQANLSLSEMPLVVMSKEVLLRNKDELIDGKGQRWFDFDAFGQQSENSAVAMEAAATVPGPGVLPEELCQMALELEESGQLAAAAEMYRAALMAGGPDAGICFLLAEILYRLGDLPAARERYYQVLELDENYVEARVNLGCILSELGQLELAAASFEGALRFHPDYADAHYQLAKTLDELGQPDKAAEHWQKFLELAPDSPWADVARQRLGENER